MRWIDLAPYGLKLGLVSILRDAPQENVDLSVFSGVVPEYHEGLAYCGYRQHKTNPGIWFRPGSTVDIDRIASVFDECIVLNNFDIERVRRVVDQRTPAVEAGPAAPVEVAAAQAAPETAQAQPASTPTQFEATQTSGRFNINQLNWSREGESLISSSTIQFDPSETFEITRGLWEAPLDLRATLQSRSIRVMPKDSGPIIEVGKYALYQGPDANGDMRRYARYVSPFGGTVLYSEGNNPKQFPKIEQVIYLRPQDNDTLASIFDLHVLHALENRDTGFRFHTLAKVIDKSGLDADVNMESRYTDRLVRLLATHAHKKPGTKGANDFRAMYDAAAKLYAPEPTPIPAYMAVNRLARSISSNERDIALSIGSPMANRFVDQVVSNIGDFIAGQDERRLAISQLIIFDATNPDYAEILAKPIDYDGYKAKTVGEAALLDILQRRQDKSRVIILSNTDMGEDFWGHIACRYAIEGRAVIDKSASHEHVTLASIGYKRPDVSPTPPEASMRKKVALDWSDIWDWTSEVVLSRGKIKKFYEEAGISEKESVVANNFQAEYSPMSSAVAPFTMVPRNIENAVRSAFSSFIKSYGDADSYVAKLFSDAGYEVTPQGLANMFSAEQIDAIAMSASVKSRGMKGFLLADQTGVGKGRFCASMAFLGASGVLGTTKTLLLTERPNNISDLVRDMRNIGILDKKNIAILNSGVKIINNETQEITSFDLSKDVWNDCFERGVWPDSIDIIIGTYSNFNRSDVVTRKVGRGKRARLIEDQVVNAYTRKSAWVKKVVGSDVMLVRDESQNGSNNSQIGKTIAKIIDQAGHVVSSSGSYVRDPKSISQYPELFPPSMAGQNMASILSKGGETAQEALAFSMAESGVMLRREHRIGLSTIVPVEPTPDEAEYNKATKDALAALISELSFMTGSISERVNDVNKAIINYYIEADPILRADLQKEDGHKALQRVPSIKMRSIGGALYSIARSFTAILAAQTKVSEITIERLKMGEKPVVLFESTNETLLREINDEFSDEDDDDIPLPKFSDVLRKIIKRSLTIYVRETRHNNRRRHQHIDQMDDVHLVVKNGKRYYLAAQQDPTAISGYIRSMARRDVLAHPAIGEIIDADDKDAFRGVIAASVERRKSDAIRYGYATDEFVTLRAAETMASIDEVLADMPCRDLLNDPTHLPIMPDNLAGYLVRIEDMLGSIPEMSSSAIDTVMENIRNAGYTVGEITGRKLRIENGKIVPRTDTDRLDTLTCFNGYRGAENSIDALVINMTGAVGNDMHASEKTPDQRPRCMVVAEMPQDVVVLLQAYGRIARFGSIHPSKIYIPSLGLVCHEQLMSMINSKVRRWSAGIAGNRNSSNSIDGVHNMLNIVGDHVARQFLIENSDIAIKLGLFAAGASITQADGTPDDAIGGMDNVPNTNWNDRSLENRQALDEERRAAEVEASKNKSRAAASSKKNKDAPDANNSPQADESNIDNIERGGETLRSAGIDVERQNAEDDNESSSKQIKMGKVIQRLIMLPSDEEQQILERLKREYDATIEEMDARGENPLRAQEIVGKVHPQSIIPMSGVIEDRSGGAFERQTVIQKVLIEQPASPIRSAQVELYVSKSNHFGKSFLSVVSHLEAKEARYFMAAGRSIEEEIADGNQRVINIRNNANNVRWAIANLAPGNKVETIIDSERVWGISLGVFDSAFRTTSVSGYDVRLVIPGAPDVVSINLKTLLADSDLQTSPGLNGDDRDELLNHFDTQSEASRIRERMILTGNAWNAICIAQAMKFGHMVSWAGHGGVVNRGVLLNSKVSLSNIPTEIASNALYEDIMSVSNASARIRTNIKYYLPRKNDEQRSDNSHVTFYKSNRGFVKLTIRKTVQDFEVDLFKNDDAMMAILEHSAFDHKYDLYAFIKSIDIAKFVKKYGRDRVIAACTEVMRKSAIAITQQEATIHRTDFNSPQMMNFRERLITEFDEISAQFSDEEWDGSDFNSPDYGGFTSAMLVMSEAEFKPVFGAMIDAGLHFYGASSMRRAIMKLEAARNKDKSTLARIEAMEEGEYQENPDNDEIEEGELEDDGGRPAGGRNRQNNRVQRRAEEARRQAPEPANPPPRPAPRQERNVQPAAAPQRNQPAQAGRVPNIQHSLIGDDMAPQRPAAPAQPASRVVQASGLIGDDEFMPGREAA
jgi:hypothetical protein